MKSVIKVGFCVSYDWELLKKSIPRIYKESDLICLAIDKNRKSWSGNKYEINNDEFLNFISEIDTDKKIDLYEDDFALSDLNSRENCNRHRMKIAERMGKGGWHIQIDSDEYFFNFQKFVKFLRSINSNPTGDEKGFNVSVNLIPLIKKTSAGYLFVDFKNKLPEAAPFATNRPNYERARHNGYFCILSPSFVLHETWARSEDDLWYKLNNWGHASEELQAKQSRLSYYQLWKSLDEFNYSYIHNFHPAKPTEWPSLNYCAAESIEVLFAKMKEPSLPIKGMALNIYNTKLVAKLREMVGDPFRND